MRKNYKKLDFYVSKRFLCFIIGFRLELSSFRRRRFKRALTLFVAFLIRFKLNRSTMKQWSNKEVALDLCIFMQFHSSMNRIWYHHKIILEFLKRICRILCLQHPWNIICNNSKAYCMSHTWLKFKWSNRGWE